MKTSEKLSSFLDFVRQSEPLYRLSYEAVGEEDKRTLDYLHAIEFDTSARERNKICEKLKISRVRRRKNKDVVEELEPLKEFMEKYENRKAIEQLQQVLGKIRKVENYHEKRSYHQRTEDKGE